MLKLFRRIMTDNQVEAAYKRIGGRVGDAFSYAEPIFPAMVLSRLVPWEAEYARRGYRTVPFKAFIYHGGWGKSIAGFLGQKRDSEEEPVYFTARFRDAFLGREVPEDELEVIVSKTQEAEIILNQSRAA